VPGDQRPAATETPRQAARRERRAERRSAGMGAHQDAEEWRQAWSQLSTDDKATLTQAWVGVSEYVKGLTPTQKERIRDAAQRSADTTRVVCPESPPASA